MEAGGFLDQDWGATVAGRYLDRVYRVVSQWRLGRPLQEDDAQLILRLSKQGLM